MALIDQVRIIKSSNIIIICMLVCDRRRRAAVGKNHKVRLNFSYLEIVKAAKRRDTLSCRNATVHGHHWSLCTLINKLEVKTDT